MRTILEEDKVILEDLVKKQNELIKKQNDRINQLELIIKSYESDKTKINYFNEVIKNIYIKLRWVNRISKNYEWTKNKPIEIPTLKEFVILAFMCYLPVVSYEFKSINTYGLTLNT